MVDVDLDKLEEEPDIKMLRKICVDEIKHFKTLKETYGPSNFMEHV